MSRLTESIPTCILAGHGDGHLVFEPKHLEDSYDASLRKMIHSLDWTEHPHERLSDYCGRR